MNQEQSDEESDTEHLSPADRFDDLCTELVGIEGVTPPQGGRGFGRGALRYNGKIFAMLVRGSLVVKLPADRVRELVEAEHGIPFDANKGTPMKEWFSLDPEAGIDAPATDDSDHSGPTWLSLALEALDFARAHS
jgi:hypothetical protein